MITLYQFNPAFGLPNASPFCMKVEVFLKMAGLDYQTKIIGDPGKAPNGKLPYIVDDGETIADSAFILEHLISKHRLNLNHDYSDRDLAIGDAVVKLFEEHYYWSLLHSRWIDDRYWPSTKKAFFGSLPLPLQMLIPTVARGKIKTQIYQQGTGRHSEDLIYQLGRDDLDTLNAILGDNDYLLGNKPCISDASVYAFLANALVPPMETPLKKHAESKPALVAYCDRMRDRYFS